jgi:hypothetical protein
VTRAEQLEQLTAVYEQIGRALARTAPDDFLSCAEISASVREMLPIADALAIPPGEVLRDGELKFGARYRILELEPGQDEVGHKVFDIFTAVRGNDWRIATCWVVRSDTTIDVDPPGSFVTALQLVEEFAP